MKNVSQEKLNTPIIGWFWDVVDTSLLVKLHIGITLLIVVFLTLFQAAIMQKENGL